MLSNQKWRKRIDDLEVESIDKLLVGGINPVYTTHKVINAFTWIMMGK